MTTAALYTTNNRYFINGKEVFSADEKLKAMIFGEVTSREILVSSAGGRTKNKAYEAAYRVAVLGDFNGTITKTVYS